MLRCVTMNSVLDFASFLSVGWCIDQYWGTRVNWCLSEYRSLDSCNHLVPWLCVCQLFFLFPDKLLIVTCYRRSGEEVHAEVPYRSLSRHQNRERIPQRTPTGKPRVGLACPLFLPLATKASSSVRGGRVDGWVEALNPDRSDAKGKLADSPVWNTD